MEDIDPQSDQNATPEDVAKLYSWANLHGAKYRDFSAARAQTREKFRLRAGQATEAEQGHSGDELEAAHGADAEQAADEAVDEAVVVAPAAQEPAAHEQAHEEPEHHEPEHQEPERQEQARSQLAHDEQARQAEFGAELAALQAERAAQLVAAQQAAEQAARLEAEQAALQAAQEAAELALQEVAQRAGEHAAGLAEEQAEQQAEQRAWERAAEEAAQQLAQQRAWQQPPTGRFPASPASSPAAPFYPQQPQKIDYQDHARPQAYHPPASQYSGQPQYGPVRGERVREESSAPRSPWVKPDVREPAGRPAWLTTESQETAGPFAPKSGLPQAPSGLPQAPLAPPFSLPRAPEDTLQGSRDRLTSRWFALRGVFDGAPAQPETLPAPVVAGVPSMAVFSLAGGVGKTSLVATLGRALSARGEKVLLVDTAAFGLLPFFFGATDQRPGLLRTFNPPGESSDAPIQLVTIDPESLSAEQAGQESLSGEIAKFARGASRVIIDLATASGATTRRILRMAPMVLVPVVADMNSVVSVSSIDAFFEHNGNLAGKPALPYYVLNQFDSSLPLHLDVREVLREQLGERLLPFALRRTPAMSEALAEGMTVMDYAPGSALAEDFATLAGWVKSLSVPATTSYRGVRWSER
jgi:cellulose synthase operon protein YhjQ